MEEYKIVMDLNRTDKSYELISFDNQLDAVNETNDIIRRLDSFDYILPLGRKDLHITKDDITFLGVVKHSYPFTSVSYIGIYEGVNAHNSKLMLDKKIRERLNKEYGETIVALASAFANLSSYYIQGNLVSTDKASQTLQNHRMFGYGFYRDLCEAVRGSFSGVIRYDFPSERFGQSRTIVDIVTPSNPSVLSKPLDSYQPPDRFEELSQEQLDNDYEQALARFDKIPNEFCIKDLFAHYFVRLFADRGIA